MLQRGKAVADILVYYGEDSNVCAEVSVSEMPGFIPAGYNYDYAGPTVVKDELGVKNGRLTAGNMEYSVLYLDENSERMSVSVLGKLVELASKGAVICGHAPKAPAGMMDDPQEWNSLMDKLKTIKNVHFEEPLYTVLNNAGIVPDIMFHPEENILFVHRSLPGTDIYWINRPGAKGQAMEILFRQTGKDVSVWHPETGKIEEVPFRTEGGMTVVSLDLAPDDAIFVVFSGKAASESKTVKPVTVRTAVTVEGPWNVTLREKKKGRKDYVATMETTVKELTSLAESPNPSLKYFSGKADYSTTFNVEALKDGERLFIDLGDVRDIAVVKINGKPVGTLWKLPYRADITEMAKPGENQLEITVINPWHNRLVGDSQNPSAETFTSYKFFDASSPLLPSGLLGPVTVSITE